MVTSQEQDQERHFQQYLQADRSMQKMTVIVYPNDVVEQWGGNDIKEGNIKEAFPDSIVTKGKDAFSVVRNEKKHQYLVLNYDKFSQVIRPLFRQGKEIAGRRVR